ncbi:V-type ATP synthase subunit I [Clarias magur]|uniref:V-type ATP synthase subunit I n=1 Tax=Clarias magur TaxID=1594786 RepID=A0A8J4UPY5_CLAMG|nr:V-type ATP synthase subunit I [Clarias magur]
MASQSHCKHHFCYGILSMLWGWRDLQGTSAELLVAKCCPIFHGLTALTSYDECALQGTEEHRLLLLMPPINNLSLKRQHLPQLCCVLR